MANIQYNDTHAYKFILINNICSSLMSFSRSRQHFLRILANPFISRNGPIWKLNEARNCPNQGHNLEPKMRPKMLRKIGHCSSRLSFVMRMRRKCQFFQTPATFSGNPVQSIHLQKWANLEATHGSKLLKSGS